MYLFGSAHCAHSFGCRCRRSFGHGRAPRYRCRSNSFAAHCLFTQLAVHVTHEACLLTEPSRPWSNDTGTTRVVDQQLTSGCGLGRVLLQHRRGTTRSYRPRRQRAYDNHAPQVSVHITALYPTAKDARISDRISNFKFPRKCAGADGRPSH